MKKYILSVIAFFLLSLSLIGQNIEPAPKDKAVVYFTRTSYVGLINNFSYFDSTKLIGVFDSRKYIRYECEPGNRLFWARSENKSFIEAELEAGKIYFIEALPTMGMLKVGVELKAVDPNDTKKMNKIFKLLKKKPSESFSAQQIQAERERLKGVVDRGMKKYEKGKRQGRLNPQLKKTMSYNNN